MNDLQIFKNDEFGEVRTIVINEQPFLMLKDVCSILGLTNSSKVKERLKEDGVTTSYVIDRLGRKQEAKFINESNLYRLIFQSRKPEAEKFSDWVTSEVLPAIRKTGKYELVPVEVEESHAQEGQYLDLTQLELDQRIKIATIIASCRRERLALVAKVLSLDVEGLKPVTPKEQKHREFATEDDIHDFIQSEWDKMENTVPVFVFYTRYQNWCRLKRIIPVAKQVFGSVFLRYYPIRTFNMRYRMPDGTQKTCKAYHKIEDAPMEGGAKK